MIFLVSACFIFSDRVSTCCARNRQNSGFCKLLESIGQPYRAWLPPRPSLCPHQKDASIKLDIAMRCAVSLPPSTLPDRPFQKAERDRRASAQAAGGGREGVSKMIVTIFKFACPRPASEPGAIVSSYHLIGPRFKP